MTPPENAKVYEWPGSIFWFDENEIMCSISRPAPNPLADMVETERSPSNSIPPVSYTAPLISRPTLNLTSAPAKRQFAVRPAHLVEDGHSRAEHQVYAQLWESAGSFDDISRIITLGFASMGKLTALSESNARINLRSLVQKLAIDEHTTYNCAASQGRTYRVYDAAEILRRRHAAGLSWVMRRTWVPFVFIVYSSRSPSRVDVKMIRLPLGATVASAL